MSIATIFLATILVAASTAQQLPSSCIFGPTSSTYFSVGLKQLFCARNGNLGGSITRCTENDYIFRCRGIRIADEAKNATINKSGTDMNNLCTSLVNTNEAIRGKIVWKFSEDVVIGVRGDYDYRSDGTWTAATSGVETIDNIDCWVAKNS